MKWIYVEWFFVSGHKSCRNYQFLLSILKKDRTGYYCKMLKELCNGRVGGQCVTIWAFDFMNWIFCENITSLLSILKRERTGYYCTMHKEMCNGRVGGQWITI